MNRFDEINNRLVQEWNQKHKGILWTERILKWLGILACVAAWLLDHFVYIEDFPILVYGIGGGVLCLVIFLIMKYTINPR